jgi:hypothetical protein
MGLGLHDLGCLLGHHGHNFVLRLDLLLVAEIQGRDGLILLFSSLFVHDLLQHAACVWSLIKNYWDFIAS